MIPTAQQLHADSSFSVSMLLLQQHPTPQLSCPAKSHKRYFSGYFQGAGEGRNKKKVQLHLNIQDKAIAMHQAVTTVTVGSKPRTLHGD